MNQATNTQTATNKLTHSIISKDAGGNTMYIKIRLDDECKNGHQDFAITGDIYEAGKSKIDRYHISGGCIHEDILKTNPELKIFINLHLCDYEGIPTYAVENGFYHLTNGFNNTKPESPKFAAEYCEYYRLSTSQFDTLKNSRNQLQYALNIQNLGILTQWKKEANKAIKLLEEMTGQKFLVDSVKTQFHAPTPEAIKEEKQKEDGGYYTPEAEQQREINARQSIIDKLQAECDKDVKKAVTEFEVKKAVLIIGGKKALDNCIFYNHTNTLAFNWKTYDNISTELIEKIKAEITLSEGVTIENKTV